VNAIALRQFHTTDDTVRYEFDYPKRVNRFFSGEDFVVEYDVSIEEVPEGILTIPWLANVCPIAWATGTDVAVPTLDSHFAESIPRVGAAFEDVYPDLVNPSTIRVREEDETRVGPSEFEDTAMLFSGGVDSVATYDRHCEAAPTLISIHGHDVSLNDEEGWAEKRSLIERFAAPRGLETHYVRANVVSFQEPFMLYAHFGSELHSDWINAVHLGLGLSGLCAPLAFVEGFGRVYISDSSSRLHHAASVEEVANHPAVVIELAWSGTTVRNDGYPLTRQEKVDLIAAEVGEEPLTLHVCLESATGNCSRCEKCLRTASALLLSGLDPNGYGFDLEADILEYARQQFEAGAWTLDERRLVHWKDLQRAARERRPDREFDDPAVAAFVDWLADTDVERFRERNPQLRRQLLCATARHAPYPVYTKAKNVEPVVSAARWFLNR
jgi:hypothetical protein